MSEELATSPSRALPVAEAQVTASALETLQRARNAEGAERLALASELNLLLRAEPSDTEREPWARFVLEQLDDEAFHDLYDRDGLSCRAVAVEAALALGFPHALHLDPDDLFYLRAVKPARVSAGRWRALALVTGMLAALFALAFFTQL